MRLYYVFGALVLLGLLQSAMAREGFGSSEERKKKKSPEDCIFNQNTTTAALKNEGVNINCLRVAHVTELNVTGDDGNVCATLNDQGFQQCMWETKCKLKIDLTTVCSEEIDITHVCRFRPRGFFSLYNVRNNQHKKKTNTSGNEKQKKKAKGKKKTKGRRKSSRLPDMSQGLVLSHSIYLRRKFSRMNHPPSKVTIKRPENIDMDHLVFTIYTMDVGSEKLDVTAEDSDGTTRKISYTGALTLSDELSKRTAVISDIKPHNVTVSLSGLPASDVRKGFGLCYKWINWDPANQKKETYDTCKHINTRCLTPKIYKMWQMRASRKSHKRRGEKDGATKGKNKKGKGAAKKEKKGKGGAKKGKKDKGGAKKGKKGKGGAKKGKKGKGGAKKGKKGKGGAKKGKKGKGGAKKGKEGKKGSKKDGGARKKHKGHGRKKKTKENQATTD